MAGTPIPPVLKKFCCDFVRQSGNEKEKNVCPPRSTSEFPNSQFPGRQGDSEVAPKDVSQVSENSVQKNHRPNALVSEGTTRLCPSKRSRTQDPENESQAGASPTATNYPVGCVSEVSLECGLAVPREQSSKNIERMPSHTPVLMTPKSRRMGNRVQRVASAMLGETSRNPTLPSPTLSPIIVEPPNPPPSSLEACFSRFAAPRTVLSLKNGGASPFADSAGALLRQGSAFDAFTMVEVFGELPHDTKSYVLFQLLKRCPSSTLQYIGMLINSAIKRDFLSELPLELALNIARFLDAKSLCRAAQTSKHWRMVVDSSAQTWKSLLLRDGYWCEENDPEAAALEEMGLLAQTPAVHSASADRNATVSFRLGELIICSPEHGTSIASRNAASDRNATAYSPSDMDPEPSGMRTPVENVHNSASQAPKEIEEQAGAGKSLETYATHPFKSEYRYRHSIQHNWYTGNSRNLSFAGHGNNVVTCLQIDERRLVSGSDDNSIHIYDITTGSLLRRLEGHEGGVWALQYVGSTLVSGSTDRTVRVWDMERGVCTHIFPGHTSTVRCLQIVLPLPKSGSSGSEPEVPLIVTGSRDNTLRVWKLPSPVTDPPFQPTESMLSEVGLQLYNPYLLFVLQGHTSSVRALAAAGNIVVSGSYDTSVRVWNLATGNCIWRLTGHAQKVYSVVLDSKRNQCMSGSMDSTVKIWSLSDGSCLHTLRGHSSLVGLLDLCGEYLVSAAADTTLRVWSPSNGHCSKVLQSHTGAITCFQHDKTKVVSGSDGSLKMWDLSSGRFVRDLLTDLNGVWQVKFNHRRCVAAVQRGGMTWFEVLDFGHNLPAHWIKPQ